MQLHLDPAIYNAFSLSVRCERLFSPNIITVTTASLQAGVVALNGTMIVVIAATTANQIITDHEASGLLRA